MSDRYLSDGLAVVASSYAKRFLETQYDHVMRTDAARILMAAGKPTRYGIEAALYALTAYADLHWSTHTPLRRFVREIALDAPAELSKRLVNGFREEVMSAKSAPDTERHAVEIALLQLDEDILSRLLQWLAQTTEQDRAQLRTLLPRLSDEEIQKAATLQPNALEALLRLNTSVSTTRAPRSEESKLSTAIRDELREAHRRVDEQLAARRRKS